MCVKSDKCHSYIAPTNTFTFFQSLSEALWYGQNEVKWLSSKVFLIQNSETGASVDLDLNLALFGLGQPNTAGFVKLSRWRLCVIQTRVTLTLMFLMALFRQATVVTERATVRRGIWIKQPRHMKWGLLYEPDGAVNLPGFSRPQCEGREIFCKILSLVLSSKKYWTVPLCSQTGCFWMMSVIRSLPFKCYFSDWWQTTCRTRRNLACAFPSMWEHSFRLILSWKRHRNIAGPIWDYHHGFYKTVSRMFIETWDQHVNCH